MVGVLAEFWAQQDTFTQHNGYHGPQFRATCGTKQGGMTSPTIFNVALDNVFRHWLFMIVEDDAVIRNNPVYAVVHIMGVFCTDYGLFG